MAEKPSADRSEAPTPKRLEEARKKGQIARSRELNTTAMLLAGAVGLLFLGPYAGAALERMFRGSLAFERARLDSPAGALELVQAALFTGFAAIAPLLLLSFVVAMTAPALLGGFSFSTSAFLPKFSRMNPVSGLGRIFGVRGLVELGKALGKVFVVGSVAAFVLWESTDDVLAMASWPLAVQIGRALEMMGIALLLLALATAPIAIVDVPFQLWDHMRQLKMTRQEVLDEMKDVEGRPEVKQRIRRLQDEIARGRMMARVPDADVVITNPTHYAAALAYDADADGAPRLVAKGVDEVAAAIRELAQEHGIPVLEAPPLARALHAGVDLEAEVPAELYSAVAQVLAWVYGVDAARRNRQRPPAHPKRITVPAAFDPHSDEFVRPQRRRRR
ncbi:MAG: flagellar biosynthesis protein FlhB [Pseudomonadales bacterium]|jgi:flagellar biosynthetic protein FlhB|nr:flagellar biosynthesis protein FlhB [Pseudomonadales bacterium]